MFFSQINPFLRRAYADCFEDRVSVCRLAFHHYRLLYIYEGEAVVYANNSWDVHHIKKDDIIFVPPGTPHDIENMPGIPLKFYEINFDFTQNHSFNDEYIPAEEYAEVLLRDITERVNFSDFTMWNDFAIFNNQSPLEKDFSTIIYEFVAKDFMFREKCSSLFRCILIEITRQFSSNINIDSNNLLVKKICEYINQHYAEEISNSDIGKECGYHSYYLNKILKRKTGKTIHQYLIEKRIQEANYLIAFSDMPISEIAFQVGFQSQSNFSVCFKNITGCSPLQLRSKYKEE